MGRKNLKLTTLVYKQPSLNSINWTLFCVLLLCVQIIYIHAYNLTNFYLFLAHLLTFFYFLLCFILYLFSFFFLFVKVGDMEIWATRNFELEMQRIWGHFQWCQLGTENRLSWGDGLKTGPPPQWHMTWNFFEIWIPQWHMTGHWKQVHICHKKI